MRRLQLYQKRDSGKGNFAKKFKTINFEEQLWIPASNERQIKNSGGNIIFLRSRCVIQNTNLPESGNLNPRTSGWGVRFKESTLAGSY